MKRDWREEHSVAFLRVWEDEPVFHGYGWDNEPRRTALDNGDEIQDYTSICGLALSTYRVYADGRPGRFTEHERASLPLRHALRFGRPCKKCFTQVQ